MNNSNKNDFYISNFSKNFDLKLSDQNNLKDLNGFNYFSLKLAMDRFLLQVDVAISSRVTYKKGLVKFLKWCDEVFGKEINFVLSKESLISYKQYLDNNTNLQPFTRSLYLVCLRQFFGWTESIFLYPNISKGIKGIKRLTKSHHKDSLQKESIKFLLNSIDKKSIQGIRDYTLIYLLVHTGMRLMEVSGILLSDIDRDPVSLTARVWIRGKGREGKDSFVVLLPEVLEIIDNYIERRMENQKLEMNSFLFVSHGRKSKHKYIKRMTSQSLSRIIRERMKKAGVKQKRVSAHSLRHTFGVLAIKGGASLYEVQLAMRHSSPATTQVYLGDIEQIKRQEASPEHKVRDLLK